MLFSSFFVKRSRKFRNLVLVGPIYENISLQIASKSNRFSPLACLHILQI